MLRHPRLYRSIGLQEIPSTRIPDTIRASNDPQDPARLVQLASLHPPHPTVHPPHPTVHHPFIGLIPNTPRPMRRQHLRRLDPLYPFRPALDALREVPQIKINQHTTYVLRYSFASTVVLAFASTVFRAKSQNLVFRS